MGLRATKATAQDVTLAFAQEYTLSRKRLLSKPHHGDTLVHIGSWWGEFQTKGQYTKAL